MFSHLADKISCKLVTAFSRKARADGINKCGWYLAGGRRGC